MLTVTPGNAEIDDVELGPAKADRKHDPRTEMLRSSSEVIASRGVRITMRQIAQSSGRSFGALYHHFDSKDDLLIELVKRYHADLTRVGENAQARLDRQGRRSTFDQLAALATDIALCAVENRAALQMSFYETPSNNRELIALLSRPPLAVKQAMLQTLRAGSYRGEVAVVCDLSLLADRICQCMLHIGLDVVSKSDPPQQIATLMSEIMFYGLATERVSNPALNASEAFTAAEEAVRTWDDGDDTVNVKAGHVRASACVEFGRRGYDATTMRDIAAAAEVSIASLYQVFASKDALFAAVMESFTVKTGNAARRVLHTQSSAIEKLDALSWINIHTLRRFPHESKIQLAWARRHPPKTQGYGELFTARANELSCLVGDAVHIGAIHPYRRSALPALARCVMDALWIPGDVARTVGTIHALDIARHTLIRGIANRRIVSRRKGRRAEPLP
jgi:AcrR family transcriptional regulator